MIDISKILIVFLLLSYVAFVKPMLPVQVLKTESQKDKVIIRLAKEISKNIFSRPVASFLLSKRGLSKSAYCKKLQQTFSVGQLQLLCSVFDVLNSSLPAAGEKVTSGVTANRKSRYVLLAVNLFEFNDFCSQLLFEILKMTNYLEQRNALNNLVGKCQMRIPKEEGLEELAEIICTFKKE